MGIESNRAVSLLWAGTQEGFLGKRSRSPVPRRLPEHKPALSAQNIRVQSQPFHKEETQMKAESGLIKPRVKRGNQEST